MKRLLVAFALLAAAGPGVAAVCTVAGRIQVEPQDTYYCDTDHLTCQGWREVDLDAKRGRRAAPLAYIRVEVRSLADDLLVTDHADDNGGYRATFDLAGASCVGRTVRVRTRFQRVHGNDGAVAAPRYRFRVTNTLDTTWYDSREVELAGAVTTHNRLYEDDLSSHARVANVYYTVNSMVEAVVSWSGRVNQLFIGTEADGDVFRVTHAPAQTTTGWGSKSLRVSWDDFHEGFKIRHEMGHALHNAMHRGHFKMAQPTSSCVNSNLLGDAGHGGLSCEWGSKAMKEALASFFAVRSVTTSDAAWSCSCNEGMGFGQDVCSALAATLTSDADRFLPSSCTEGSVRGVGDAYSDSPATCARLDRDRGCACSSDPCEASFRDDHGWQNSTQVMRFLWDLIDANDESGSEGVNENIVSFVALLEGMPCSDEVWGVDGTCNEPNRKLGGQWACVPADPTQAIEAPHGATRHSYNVWDIAALVPGDQTSVRRLNCVDGATD